MAKGPGREDKACAKRAAIPAFLCCSQLSGKCGQATALNRVGFSDTFGDANGLEAPADRRSAGGHGNQPVRLRRANKRPASGRPLSADDEVIANSKRTRGQPRSNSRATISPASMRKHRRSRYRALGEPGRIVHLNPETEAMDFERSGSSASTRPVPHDPSSQSADRRRKPLRSVRSFSSPCPTELPKIGRGLRNLLDSKIVLDSCNPYVSETEEMRREVLKEGVAIASARYLPGTRLVRALSAGNATSVQDSAAGATRGRGSNCQ